MSTVPAEYASYYKGKPIGDFTGVHTALQRPSFHTYGREWNSPFHMDWFCITAPFEMVQEPHTHEFDQYLIFQNADGTNVYDFDAEVWLYVGPKDKQEKIVINEACYFYVPAGMTHTPLEFKRIGKPIVFIDIALVTTYVRDPEDENIEKTSY